jgi:hypothetical protein
MGSFAKFLQPVDAVAIREYLVSRAATLKAEQEAKAAPPPAAPVRDMHQQGTK